MMIFRREGTEWKPSGVPLWNMPSAYHYLAKEKSVANPDVVFCVVVVDDKGATPDLSRDTFYRNGREVKGRVRQQANESA